MGLALVRAAALCALLAAAPAPAASTPSAAALPPAARQALEDIGFFPAEAFDVRDGLPTTTVNTAAVMADGQVWLGTMRGLARWNSHRFVVEPGPDGALSRAIGDLAATPDGRLWASAPGRGVFVREQGAWRAVGKAVGLADEGGLRLRSFPVAGPARGGYRLFATGRGTVQEWTGAAWRTWAMPAQLAGTELFDVLLDAGAERDEDVLWVASFGRGLWRCIGASACQPVPMTVPGPRFNEITSLVRWTDPDDGSDVLWVGSYGGGLARLQGGRWERFLQSVDGLPSDFVQRLLVQPPSPRGAGATAGAGAGARAQPHLWIGTRSGVAHRIGARWVPLDASARLDGATVKALASGRSAAGAAQLWIGSDRGAARLPLDGAWRTISQSGRKGNGVWSLLYERRDGDDQLWIGSDGDGLLHYAHGAWRQYRIAHGLPSDMVRSLFRDPDTDELFVGTWGGELSRMQDGRFVTLPTPWRKSDHEAISRMLADVGGTRWFALREGGLARRGKDSAWTVYGPDDGYPSRIYDLERVGDVLWGSTNGRGLVRIDARGWRYFSRAQGLPDIAFYGLTQVPDATGRPVLWAGSLRAGVVRVDVGDPERPVAVTAPALPAPPDPFVYEVVPDGRGNMFLATNYGASLWTPDGRGGWSAHDFHRSDGMPHDESNYGALQVDAEQRIWLGTLGGLGVYSPPVRPRGIARGQAPTAPLVVERILVDGALVVASRSADLPVPLLRLDAGPHELFVEAALRTGDRESGIRYRSQLVGLEDKPTPWSGDNERNFVALPPGEYRLRFEARDADGVAARALEFAVSVPQPAWRSWPAVILAALLVAAGMIALVRLRERALRVREGHLVDLVRQRTSELESRGVELRRINEELTRLSYHDPLTDLANRRMLLERLHGEWELARARGQPLAFLLFDLDQFKAYNDQRGHLAGDDALREIGQRIAAELKGDAATAGRYGGEEFGVVLPGMDLAGAMREGERIRRAIEVAALPHPATPQGVVTISVGVASAVPHAGFGAELLIAAADAALYRAKGAGKNRVEAAGTP